MPDKKDNAENTGGGDDSGDNKSGGAGQNTPNVDEIVKNKVAEELAPIKAKLDKAYEARDAALAKVAELEKKIRDEELKRLQDAGKVTEALELQLAQEKEEKELLRKQNLELSRDSLLKSTLSALEFRSPNALDMAYKEIVNDLVRNDKGVWVHKTGVSVQDAVKAFAENQDNSFLFKQKSSSGSGSSNNKQPAGDSEKGRSVFEQSQADVLRQIAEGSLRRSRRR